MSAVPTDLQLATDHDEKKASLPFAARVYGLLVATVALALAMPFAIRVDTHTGHWITFAVLATGAAFAQLFVVRSAAGNEQAYHATPVFLLPAALLLPPELVVLMAVLQHIPEWLKERYAWYMQSFNICMYTIACMAAWASGHAVLDHGAGVIENGDARFALAGLLSVTVYVALNHGLLAPMLLNLGRGHTLRSTGIFSFESLSTDFVLAALGLVLAAFWKWNPWLIPFAITPVLLIHRSLAVPQLQAEARVDPKTGLFNARHFATVLAEELSRATRFERPLTLIMADLDLLRDINNTYGHLAGDAVLRGIAEVFRGELRHYDVPARFGGEEFCILLPETVPEQALEIAERIRRAVADSAYEVETSSEPIRATVSIGVASFPRDGITANELIHQADLAVYRAKLQGRNRVLDASNEVLLTSPPSRQPRLVHLQDKPAEHTAPLPQVAEVVPEDERRRNNPRPQAAVPRFFSIPARLGALVATTSLLGVGAGILGLVFGTSTDVIGLIAVVALVGIGQALALEVESTGSISVSAVGALAGAALFGPRAALALAITISVVEWSVRRDPLFYVTFNIGALSFASLAAAGVFASGMQGDFGNVVFVAASLVGGGAYYMVNTGLLSLAIAFDGGNERPWAAWRERFLWLMPHYVVYGFIGGVMALAYGSVGIWALAVFSVPLLLMRKTQEAYLRHTQRSAQKLREAAETIQSQNVSLEQANKLLRERSTAAMESLSATVDARDAYTAGHSRRVQQLALAIGRELGLSQAELELLGHAALFHDIGKLAIPDAILLKPSQLTEEEWGLMAKHAEEGAHIINRLGFLNDAVPAIRHHHERFDGRGYPDGLRGEDIPLGARIIHVADAFDSMLTTRVYRPARPAQDALTELRTMAGTQFCPRCVGALEAIVGVSRPVEEESAPDRPATELVVS